MFRRFACLSLLVLFSFACSVRSFAQSAPATGTIRGSVSNQATGAYLEGATVELLGENRKAYTNREGGFTLRDLPPGTYQIRIEYPGLDSQTQAVSLQTGLAEVDVSLNSRVYELEQFTVAGEREGSAAAIVAQRRSTNLQNIVTSDAFGALDHGNIQTFLERLPGVIGVTEGVSVRGMGEEYTTVDIDGTRASSARENRAQHLASIPVDMIERAEVIKATTPEVDADSLGGRINLKTKSAFDRKGRRLDFYAAGTHAFDYGFGGKSDRYGDSLTPAFGLGYSDVFSVFGKERNLGVVVNLNYEETTSISHTMSTIFRTATASTPQAGQNEYAYFEYWLFNVVKQKREGGNIRFDYKFSDDHSISVSYVNSRYTDNFLRGRSRFEGGTVDTARSDSVNYTQTFINGTVARAQQEPSENLTNKETFRLAGNHRISDFRITWDAVYDTADLQDDRRIIQAYSARTFSYSYDRTGYSLWPTITILSGQNPFTDDYSNTNRADVEARRQFTNNEIIASRLDVSRDFLGKIPFTLKSGVRYRGEERKNRKLQLRGRLIPRDLSGYLDQDWNLAGGFGRYPQYNLVDVNRVFEWAKITFLGGDHANPSEDWSWDPTILGYRDADTFSSAFLENFKFTEDIYAGYVQGSTDLGRISILTGVRFERTDLFRRFPARNRNASSALGQYNGVISDTATYNDFFPSLHVKYLLAPRVLLRTAFSTTIGRPRMDDLIASSDININNRTINVSDSQVKPQYSKNYDLSLEYYFGSLGVVSIGGFQKDITDYITTLNQTISAARAKELGAPIDDPAPGAPDWTQTGTINGGWARVRGIETNYSQQFTFLPGFWKGFGVFANYTWLRARGTYGQTGTVSPVLPRFVPRSGNAGISYAYGRVDIRLLCNYRQAYLEDLNSNPNSQNKYKGERYQLNLNTSFRVYDKIRVFADFTNLTGQDTYKYRGSVSPVRRTEINGAPFILTAGIRGNF